MDRVFEYKTIYDLLEAVKEEVTQHIRNGSWYVDTLPPTKQQHSLIELLNEQSARLFGGMTDQQMWELINGFGENNEGK